MYLLFLKASRVFCWWWVLMSVCLRMYIIWNINKGIKNEQHVLKRYLEVSFTLIPTLTIFQEEFSSNSTQFQARSNRHVSGTNEKFSLYFSFSFSFIFLFILYRLIFSIIRECTYFLCCIRLILWIMWMMINWSCIQKWKFQLYNCLLEHVREREKKEKEKTENGR